MVIKINLGIWSKRVLFPVQFRKIVQKLFEILTNFVQIFVHIIIVQIYEILIAGEKYFEILLTNFIQTFDHIIIVQFNVQVIKDSGFICFNSNFNYL